MKLYKKDTWSNRDVDYRDVWFLLFVYGKSLQMIIGWNQIMAR